jgi:hypothetical protein
MEPAEVEPYLPRAALIADGVRVPTIAPTTTFTRSSTVFEASGIHSGANFASRQMMVIKTKNPNRTRIRMPSERRQMSVLAVVTSGLALTLTWPQLVNAQSQPPAIDLATIGKICSGQTSATLPGGRGSFSDSGGYTFQFNTEKELEVSRSGQLLYKVEKLTLDDVANCVAKIAGALSQKPIPEQRECRIPSNGIERYQIDVNVPGNSPEMSGGHTQDEWCNTFKTQLSAQHKGGLFTVIDKSESTRSGCSPLNCTLYTYHCTVNVKSDPIYAYKKSPECPN